MGPKHPRFRQAPGTITAFSVDRLAIIVQELCESRVWTSWAVRPNEPSDFRGRKVLLNHASALVTTCP